MVLNFKHKIWLTLMFLASLNFTALTNMIEKKARQIQNWKKIPSFHSIIPNYRPIRFGSISIAFWRNDPIYFLLLCENISISHPVFYICCCVQKMCDL